MVVRVIDTETTGTEPTDKIVEIASVDVLLNGTIGNEQHSLVNPQVPIPHTASAIHHICDQDVADKPDIVSAIGPYQGADLYVAHNADFDRKFLDPILGSASWICTYKCALRLWPDAPSHSNQALRYQFGHVSPFGRDRAEINAHRALSDAIVTAAVFLSVSAESIAQGVPFEALKKWSAEPPLMTRFSFGKHRGQRFDAVPPDYLRWIIEKSDMDAGVKFSAAYWQKPFNPKGVYVHVA